MSDSNANIEPKTITEDELVLHDFRAYLGRLRKNQGEFVKVRRDLMISLIEEKVADAEYLVDTAAQKTRRETAL